MHAIGDVMDPVAGEHTLTTFALSILGFGLLLSGIVILGVVSDRSQSKRPLSSHRRNRLGRLTPSRRRSFRHRDCSGIRTALISVAIIGHA
jgi:hypothetical protein